MTDSASAAGLLDTSVVISWDEPAVAAALPDHLAIAAITVAELAAGPHLTDDPLEAAARQARLIQVTSTFDPLPFDGAAAVSYGSIAAAVNALGRKPRSRRADLLIAATAHSSGLDLYTRNPADFEGLDHLIRVVAL